MVAASAAVCLELRQVSLSLGSQRVLSDINLTVREGEIIGLIGPNGAGKTTLFDLIGGIYHPCCGTVIFRGQDTTGWPPHRFCHAGLGRTFQIPRPLPEMTTLGNVLTGLRFGKRAPAAPEGLGAQAKELLALVGLSHKAATPAGELTLSEQRRLEVARALATRPQLLLLDEIAAGLSPKAVSLVARLVKKLHRQGITMLIVDHFLNLTLAVCHRLVALDKGEIVTTGEPQEVIHHPEVVAAYLGTRD